MTYAQKKMKALRRMEEVHDSAECRVLSLDQRTATRVWIAGIEDDWPSEWRSLAKLPLNVLKERPLEEGEEEEDETETSDQTLLNQGGEMTVARVVFGYSLLIRSI